MTAGARLLVLGSLLIACSSGGGHWQHYRISAFNEARSRGMGVVLHFHDQNSPVCQKQKDLLEKLVKNPAFKKVGAYRVPWGSEKALEQFTRTTQPCTLIVYKGESEKTRVSGSVDERILKPALDLAL